VSLLVQMKKLSDQRNGSFEMNRLQKNVKMVFDRLILNEFLNVSNNAASD
jgi:hypothetical protein